ncbi:TetR/AcrR family transcriptional regulator [Pseudomonas tolaasii]|uniref:TetR/AcrR family transcriptional regulator n=1 Tax=Pseudomonas tolaasii TaxID=29442 RepID=UPI00036D751B|nr:TetR/AcrR family transcriptional regulator [Pseudomonas tolaasii]
MSGLRERQKERRREAILVAGIELFDRYGYSNATVEQIAAAAGVSSPTVFNYFGSKQEILFALVDRADRAAVSRARLQRLQFDNAIDALCNLNAAIMESELAVLPISIWRELMAFSFQNPISAGLSVFNECLARDTAELLRDLQARGMVRADFEPDFCCGLPERPLHFTLH